MKIHIIYCGGTLGMVQTESGFSPSQNFGDLWKEYFQPTHALHQIEIHQLKPAIDSSNLIPSHWNRLVSILNAIEDDANVLLIHGTDTLSWTSAYLYLVNRRHRLIITGSQRPVSVSGSDAYLNVEGAIRSFQELTAGQTIIYFGERVVDAQNSMKFSSKDDAAFINLLAPHSTQDPLLALSVSEVEDHSVAVIHLYPGMPIPDQIRAPFVIIEAYGAGNGPDRNLDFMQGLKNLIDNGSLVGITSSCPHGGAYRAGYSSGNHLLEQGAILLEGLTTSAAFARAHFLACKNLPIKAKAAFWRGHQH